MKTKDEALKELRDIAREWIEDSVHEYFEDNVQYANALDRCAMELTEFILKNIDDLRVLQEKP